MRRYVVMSLLAVGALGACSGEDPLSAESTGEETAAKLTLSSTVAGGSVEARQLSAGQPIEIETLVLKFDRPLTVGNLVLTLIDMQDSRCPDEAVCITAGEVKLTIGAVDNGVDLETFELVLGGVSGGVSSRLIGDYKVGVRAVLPHPVLDQVTPRENYEVALIVTRRAGNMTLSEDKAGGYRGELPPPLLGPKPPMGEKPDHSKLATLLAENRAKWAAQGAAEYTFNFSRSCFCLPDYRREATLAVASGQINSATYVDQWFGHILTKKCRVLRLVSSTAKSTIPHTQKQRHHGSGTKDTQWVCPFQTPARFSPRFIYDPSYAAWQSQLSQSEPL